MASGFRASRRRSRGGSASSASVPSSRRTPSLSSYRARALQSSSAAPSQGYDIPPLGNASGLGLGSATQRGNDEEENQAPRPPEFDAIIAAILAGENVFFTGAAGTGKSTLLRAITRALDANIREIKASAEQRPPREYKRPFDDPAVRWNYVVSASTGLAATNIGGRTMHSLSGIGIGLNSAMKIGLEEQNKAHSAWKHCGIWIIDESGLGKVTRTHTRCFHDLSLFDQVGRIVRRNSRPFGGMQVIFSGDFLQLPPITNDRERAVHGVSNPEVMYAFDAEGWDVFRPRNVFVLSRVYRQVNMRLVDMLREVRLGTVSDASWRYLQTLRREIGTVNGIEPLCLFPKKAQVHKLNMGRLRELDGDLWQNQAQDRAGVDNNGDPVPADRAWDLLTKYTRRLAHLELKVGGQVMLLANLPEFPGLINGSMGIVTRFLTYEKACKEPGIAILNIHGFRGASWADIGKTKDWPVVKFMQPALFPNIPDELLIPALPDILYNSNNRVEAVRTQVPLNLAWALTIHKAQGMTLSHVKVDLADTFESGQVYVALSRARSPEGLQVTGLDRDKIVASIRAKNFYASLEKEQPEAERKRQAWLRRRERGARKRALGPSSSIDTSDDRPVEARSDSSSTSEDTRRAIAKLKRKSKKARHRIKERPG